MGNKKDRRFERTRKDHRSKKRKIFAGNRYTQIQLHQDIVPPLEATEPLNSSASKKLYIPQQDELEIYATASVSGEFNSCKNVSGYVLFDISIFINIISDIGKCKNCTSDLTTVHELSVQLTMRVQQDPWKLLVFFKVFEGPLKLTRFVTPNI